MTPMHGAIIYNTGEKPLMQYKKKFAIGIAPRPGMLIIKFGLLYTCIYILQLQLGSGSHLRFVIAGEWD